MKSTKYADFSAVTEAAFQKEYQNLKPVLEEEARIKQQLSRLDGQVQKSRVDAGQTKGYQVTGTDVLWSGWESRTRRQLNMELARVTAQKLASMDALRLAFGRQQAVERLSEMQKAERRLALGKKQTY